MLSVELYLFVCWEGVYDKRGSVYIPVQYKYSNLRGGCSVNKRVNHPITPSRCNTERQYLFSDLILLKIIPRVLLTISHHWCRWWVKNKCFLNQWLWWWDDMEMFSLPLALCEGIPCCPPVDNLTKHPAEGALMFSCQQTFEQIAKLLEI